MIAKQTVFLTGDRSKAVPEGHEDAKFLLVREGTSIEDALAEKHNAVALIDTPAKKEAVESQKQQAPNFKDHSSTANEKPAPSTAAPVDEKGGKPAKAAKAPKAKKTAKHKK